MIEFIGDENSRRGFVLINRRKVEGTPVDCSAIGGATEEDEGVRGDDRIPRGTRPEPPLFPLAAGPGEPSMLASRFMCSGWGARRRTGSPAAPLASPLRAQQSVHQAPDRRWTEARSLINGRAARSQNSRSGTSEVQVGPPAPLTVTALAMSRDCSPHITYAT